MPPSTTENNMGQALIDLRVGLSHYRAASCSIAEADRPPGFPAAEHMLHMATLALTAGLDGPPHRRLQVEVDRIGHAAEFDLKFVPWSKHVLELLHAVTEGLRAKQALKEAAPHIRGLAEHPIFVGKQEIACTPAFRMLVLSPLTHAITQAMRQELRRDRHNVPIAA